MKSSSQTGGYLRSVHSVSTITKSDDQLTIALINTIGSVATSIAIPLAIYMIAKMFQKEIAALIGRIRSLKALGVEAELDALIQSLPPVPPSETARLPPVVPSTTSDAASSVTNIATAWLSVQLALDQAVATDPSANGRSTRSKIELLSHIDSLPTGLHGRVAELFNIRNRALHYPDVSLSTDSIKLYVENAQRAVLELQSVNS